MLILLISVSLLLIASVLINYNLLKKVEKYEEDIVLKDEFLTKVKTISEESYKKIVELDTLQAFESDDEVGYFFKTLKNVIVTLDAYMKNYTK